MFGFLNCKLFIIGCAFSIHYAESTFTSEEHSNSINFLGLSSSMFEQFLNNKSRIAFNQAREKIFDPKQNNTICVRDLMWTFMHMKHNWTWKMFDALAKPPSGVLDMKSIWLGDFYECQSVHAPKFFGQKGFTGKYCTVYYRILFEKTRKAIWSVGLCLPSSCSDENVLHLADYTTPVLNEIIPSDLLTLLSVDHVYCSVPRKWDAADISTMLIIMVFVTLSALGTAITIMKKKKANEDFLIHSARKQYTPLNFYDGEECSRECGSNAERFFGCFCLLENGSEVLKEDVRKDIGCLHGIRFLSLTWLILGHIFVLLMEIPAVGNIRELMHDINNLAFQVINRVSAPIDTLFLLSGFVYIYSFSEKTKKIEGTKKWLLFHCLRFWRFTLVYAILIAVVVNIIDHVIGGPLWGYYDITTNCKLSWWRNLLYVNNFQPYKEVCLPWTWYLSVEMQFFLISPLLVYPLKTWRSWGPSVVIFMVGMSVFTAGLLNYIYGITYTYEVFPDTDVEVVRNKIETMWAAIYTKPYCRVGPYLIGMLLGHFICAENCRSMTLSKFAQVTIWATCTVVSLSVVYLPYYIGESAAFFAFYHATGSSAFAACVAWVIFACYSGSAGPVNRILSWCAFVPFSRLSYCAFLMHPAIIMVYFMSLRNVIQVTPLVTVMLFFGFIMMTYMVSFICSVIFERPFICAQNYLIPERNEAEIMGED